MTALALSLGAAQSVSQEAALDYRDSRLIDLETRLADAEAAFARGDIDRLRLAELQFAADRADLALREASYRFDDARRSAETFGLRGTPAYEPLRFALPEPDVGRLFGVRSLQVTLGEAEAAQLRAELFRLPREVRLTASYATERISVGTEMGMFNRVPGAEVTLGYPGATNPNWTIGLRAELVIEDALVTAIDDARDRVERAEQALTDYLADYPDQVASARQLVVFAEENLTYAERALDLDERRVGDLEARVGDARAPRRHRRRRRRGHREPRARPRRPGARPRSRPHHPRTQRGRAAQHLELVRRAGVHLLAPCPGKLGGALSSVWAGCAGG